MGTPQTSINKNSMKATLCDICGEVIKEDPIIINVKDMTIKPIIMKRVLKNGVRWEKIDACNECIKTTVINIS